MNKSSQRGLIFTIIGMLCTTTGMFLMINQMPGWTYLTACILGVVIAAYGLVVVLKSARKP
ncbi:hypothetical protein [Spongiivirga citrea]|uniref:Uncharacterized protein n=1 Tax=Spongiivirga citrea TaxID=1481457 RepID=A0A6M0CRZ3_9FLAO|nr:hypothetical protein [Spongiivirga citrea]NER16670.1 hypothetical protein [Spongiivirga citrea]